MMPVVETSTPELAMPVVDLPLEAVIKPGYLTVKQVARLLGIREDSVRHLIYNGKLEAVRARGVPKLLLVKASSVEHYQKTKKHWGRKPGPLKPKK